MQPVREAKVENWFDRLSEYRSQGWHSCSYVAGWLAMYAFVYKYTFHICYVYIYLYTIYIYVCVYKFVPMVSQDVYLGGKIRKFIFL